MVDWVRRDLKSQKLDSFGSFVLHFGFMVAPFWETFRLWGTLWGHLGPYGVHLCSYGSSEEDFWSILGGSGFHFGVKIDTKSDIFRHRFGNWFWGAQVGGFLVTKTCSKQKWLKCVKHQFSVEKTIDVEVSGCHFWYKIDAKTEFETEVVFGMCFGRCWGGFGSHFGSFSARRRVIFCIFFRRKTSTGK